MSLYPAGHVYKFKSAHDKRINIDADEAKSRNTAAGIRPTRQPKTFRPKVTLIRERPTLRPTGRYL